MELGQKFKAIRKQRNYSLAECAHVAGSSASISDFENAKTSLNMDTLLALLRHLKVEYNEFFDQTDLVDWGFQAIAGQLTAALAQKDLVYLKKFVKETAVRDKVQEILVLCIQCHVAFLQNEEIADSWLLALSDYFFGLTIWTNLDISLFSLVAAFLKQEAVIVIAREILHSCQQPPRNNLDRIKIDTVLTSTLQLIKQGNKLDSFSFIEALKKLEMPSYFALQLLELKEVEAAYGFCFGDEKKAWEDYQKILDMMLFLFPSLDRSLEEKHFLELKETRR